MGRIGGSTDLDRALSNLWSWLTVGYSSLCVSHIPPVCQPRHVSGRSQCLRKRTKAEVPKAFWVLGLEIVYSYFSSSKLVTVQPDSRWGDTMSWWEEFKDRLWRILIKRAMENKVHFYNQSTTQVNQTLVSLFIYLFWCPCLIKRAN